MNQGRPRVYSSPFYEARREDMPVPVEPMS